jgi:hypothetical protein
MRVLLIHLIKQASAQRAHGKTPSKNRWTVLRPRTNAAAPAATILMTRRW